jgi:hypothetical protein
LRRPAVFSSDRQTQYALGITSRTRAMTRIG